MVPSASPELLNYEESVVADVKEAVDQRVSPHERWGRAVYCVSRRRIGVAVREPVQTQRDELTSNVCRACWNVSR